MKKKLYRFRSDIGMSLSETLAAVLIMSLVTLAIAAGITAGSRVYKRITKAAEAQTLLATNIAALSEYLEKADGTIEVSSGSDAGNLTIIIPLSEVTQTKVTIHNDSSNGIMLQYGSETEDYPLISEKANTSDLYARITNASYDQDNQTTSYTIQVKDSSDNNQISQEQDVVIRNTTYNPQVTAAPTK